MPTYSDKQIRDYAHQLEAKGAPDEDIEAFVTSALEERGTPSSAAQSATNPLGEPAPAASHAGDSSAPRRARGWTLEPDFRQAPQAMRTDQRDAMATAVRTIPGTVASLAGPVAGAPVSAAGEAGAQLIESGTISDPGAIAKAGVYGAIPGGAIFKGAGPLAAAARVAVNVGKFAAAETVGETARRSIDAGKFQTYDSAPDAVSGLSIPALMAGGFASLGEIGGLIAAKSGTRAGNFATLKAAGIEKPTLDMIFPGQASLVNRMATQDPAIAKLRLDAARPILEQFESLANGAPQHEEIFAQLRPYMGKLDAMQKEVSGLEDAATTLHERSTAMHTAVEATPQMRADAAREAAVAELNAVNARASMLHEAKANLGGFLDYDTTAKQFGQVVDQLFAARKSAGAALFEASGVPVNQPIFEKSSMLAAAKRGLSRWRGTDTEKRILGAIEDAGGEDSTHLTLAQFRELRSSFADRFSDLDPRQIPAAEAASRSAYGSLTEQSKKAIADLPGADVAGYQKAVDYWRATSESSSSRYVRPLLAAEPSESTFQTLANDLASGRKAEVRAFNEFVDTVAKDSPQVAQLARQQLTQAIRNSFLGNSRTALGIDARKLTDSLLRAHGQIDVSTLGFGDVSDIRRWAQTLREFRVKNLSEADFHSMFADPQVQQALADGRPIADSLRPAAARIAFGENMRRQMLLGLAGKTEAARGTASEAERLANSARLTLDQRRAILAEVQSDPIAAAFGGGQTWGIPSRPGGITGNAENGITRTMMELGPINGLALARALRLRSPGLAEQVQQRVLADSIQSFFRPANTPGNVWAVNKAEVQRFFRPKPGSPEASHAATLNALIGPEKFKGMEKLFNAVTLLADIEKSGGIISTDGSKTIFANSNLARDMAGHQVSSSVINSALRSVRNLADNGRYRLLAAIASPGKWQDAFWANGGNLSRAVDSLGAQRFILLASNPALKREIDSELDPKDSEQN